MKRIARKDENIKVKSEALEVVGIEDLDTKVVLIQAFDSDRFGIHEWDAATGGDPSGRSSLRSASGLG